MLHGIGKGSPTVLKKSLAWDRTCPIYVTSYDVGQTKFGAATILIRPPQNQEESNSLILPPRMGQDGKRKPVCKSYFPESTVLSFIQMSKIKYAETMNLLKDNHAASEKVAGNSFVQRNIYLRESLLVRKNELLLIPPETQKEDAPCEYGYLPHLSVIESQGGLATDSIKVVYGGLVGFLNGFYSALPNSVVSGFVPVMCTDSGRTKGGLAHAIFKLYPHTFTQWVKAECASYLDVLTWWADWANFGKEIFETHSRIEWENHIIQIAADAATEGKHQCSLDDFRRIVKEHPTLQSAISRILHTRPNWLKSLSKKEQEKGKAKKTKSKKKAPTNAETFQESLFEDGDIDCIEFLKDPNALKNLQHVGNENEEEEINTFLRIKGPSKRVTQRRRIRREWNKIIVLCAAETLLKHMRTCWDDVTAERWVHTRNASRKDVREERRDMADAILQGIGVAFHALVLPPTTRKRSRKVLANNP